MSTYYVTRIEEPDFGCEGRPEGQEIKDKVYLKDFIYKLDGTLKNNYKIDTNKVGTQEIKAIYQ